MVSLDPIPPDAESLPPADGTIVEEQSSPWRKEQASDASSMDCETIEIVNGEASVQVPSVILTDPNILWKSFVVGYFIGDAPHAGPFMLQSTVIEKNMVLFHVENPQTRLRVLRRKYWHVSDVPLVVNEWSLATASTAPEIFGMPMWVSTYQG